MAEGGGRRSTLRWADKLSPPGRQCGSSAAPRASQRQSLRAPPPPEQETHTGGGAGPTLLVGSLFLLPHFSPPSLFVAISAPPSEKRLVFSLIQTLQLSKLLCFPYFPPHHAPRQTAHGGACSHSLLLFCLISSPRDTELFPSEHPAFQPGGAGENAWLTPFYSVYSKVP